MKYMLLIAHGPDTGTEEMVDQADQMKPWFDYNQALIDAGVYVAGDPLAPADTATTVRVRDGERLLTDGPFETTKEHLQGYYVVDVPGLDEALDWAAQIPNVGTGSIEVRAIPDMGI